MRLIDVFDARANSLNAIRLALASGVILFHSFEVLGVEIAAWPARQFLESFWVDGFFAISGFLIVRSWMRRPDVVGFIRARALRILPGFYVCLILTAAAFAPIGAMLAGTNLAALMPSALTYVAKNAGLYIFQPGIAGTPTGVPYEGYWNVSLWTLAWEAGCYVLVLAAGVVGLLRKSWALSAMAAGAWLIVLAGALGLHHIAPAAQFGRFTLMFLCGALVYQFAAKVPAQWGAVAVSAAVVTASLWLPDCRLVSAPFIAHVMLVIGSRMRRPWMILRNDFSYGVYIYGFPVQQLLVLAGLSWLPVPGFAVLALAVTLPLAAASWFLVERNALRWKAPRHRAESLPSRVTV